MIDCDDFEDRPHHRPQPQKFTQDKCEWKKPIVVLDQCD